MIPPRLLALLALAWLTWRAMRGVLRYLVARRRLPPPNAPGPQPAAGSTRRCAHCGLFVPLEEGLVGPDERFFCCATHRDLQRDLQQEDPP